MAEKLYVGNIPHSLNDNELQDLFASYGTVVSAHVIIDRETGRSKGFGFVELSNKDEAQAAISALNGSEVGGRVLTVNEARPQTERRPRFNGGGDRDRRGGGGGRRY